MTTRNAAPTAASNFQLSLIETRGLAARRTHASRRPLASRRPAARWQAHPHGRPARRAAQKGGGVKHDWGAAGTPTTLRCP